MHVFSSKQPDLNWENPTVRNELYKMVNWWLDKGIDGFRVDAISHIKKIAGFPDMPNPDNLKYVPSYEGHMNRDGIQVFLEELKQNTFAKYDIMTVGEANGVSLEQADGWVGEKNGKFDMIFQFEHLGLWRKETENGIDLPALKKTLTKWQKGLDGTGWNALFLENHDQPRSVSTWGNDGEYRVESAKALATMYFLMHGTPFIYQGQEIGMTNVQFPSIDDYDDVGMRNFYFNELEKGTPVKEIMEVIWKTGRDNSRTPMQWTTEKNAGFSTGNPWMKVNPNYTEINVEAEMKNPDSIYHYYKKLIQLRKEYHVLVYGSYDIIMEDHEQIYAYTRRQGDELILVLSNLFANETNFTLPEGLISLNKELLLSNYDNNDEKVLKPFEARVYKVKK
jgi:alpha-glucosidase